jgi:hypothetical protein
MFGLIHILEKVIQPHHRLVISTSVLFGRHFGSTCVKRVTEFLRDDIKNLTFLINSDA